MLYEPSIFIYEEKIKMKKKKESLNAICDNIEENVKNLKKKKKRKEKHGASLGSLGRRKTEEVDALSIRGTLFHSIYSWTHYLWSSCNEKKEKEKEKE